jgi:hypothetical protein
MNIPAIGGTKGIFEIFIPGVFLLLNLAVFAYLLPFSNNEERNLIIEFISNPVLGLIVIISFGYLVGVILRLLKTEPVDELSARFIQLFNSNAQNDGKLIFKFLPFNTIRNVFNSKAQNDGKFKLWAYEEFPYIKSIGEICKSYLPPDAQEFYEKTWGSSKGGKQFINFYKTIISSIDEKAASEIYSAESLSRYISGIFYSLVFASCLLFISFILNYFIFGKILIIIFLMLIGYFFGILTILWNLRFMRIKEVEIIFAATFIHRSIFENNT